jgi:hypothetical protein
MKARLATHNEANGLFKIPGDPIKILAQTILDVFSARGV